MWMPFFLHCEKKTILAKIEKDITNAISTVSFLLGCVVYLDDWSMF